jgi:hypothetical protein
LLRCDPRPPPRRSPGFARLKPSGGAAYLHLRDDLVSVFGARANAHGHQEPAIDDDDWATVDRAAPAIDAQFAAFL